MLGGYPMGTPSVGIDSKAQVDVAVQSHGRHLDGPASQGGLRRLRSWLAARRPTRIVLEATGGYERAVVAGLGWPAGGRGQSAPDPRLRPGPRQPGQDRPH